MKDRIPAPGKANRVRITQDNGQSVEGTLSYVDDAIQAGSRYTKQNVLPDDVCDALNIDRGGAEPKDAFHACWAVGDVKTTTRASLGANWHLCDGSNFVAADLPELSAIIGPSIERGFKRFAPFDSVYTPTAAQVVNGYYVALGGQNNNSGVGVIGYTDSLTKPWASAALPTIGGGQAQWMDIIYDGRQYVALCEYRSQNSAGGASAYIAYAPQLWGPWVLIETPAYGDNFSKRLLYSDGEYCFAFRRNTDLNAAICRSSAVGSGWDTHRVGSKLRSVYAAVYFGGCYVAVGHFEAGDSEGFYTYSRDLTNWTEVAVDRRLEHIAVGNGYLVMGDSAGKIRYATSPAGSFEVKQVLTGAVKGLSYAGKFVAIGTSGSVFEAAEAATPNGTWNKYTWNADGVWIHSPATCVAASNNGLIMAYAPGDTETMTVFGYSDDLRSYPKIDLGAPTKSFIRIR